MSTASTRGVVVTGGTGYMGGALITQLLSRGHRVTALTRAASRARVPAGAGVVEGSALEAGDVARALTPGCVAVLLVGTPHPNPSKAREFQAVDLASARAAAAAVATVPAAHVVYVSVAHPAPLMRAYVEARQQAEGLLERTGLPCTFLRPWYVLGPGHRWPHALVPIYWMLERLPRTRDTARRLGLVTLDAMVAALVQAVESPPPATPRVIDVPAIRAAGADVRR
ncbi:MAG: NAD(P)H-binding protein [Acidobacteriota bacterium]